MLKVYVSSQGSLCTLKVAGAIKSKKEGCNAGLRGVITGFSAAARRRLSNLFAILDKAMFSNAIFLTVTYGQKFPSARAAKKHIHDFMKKIDRHLESGSGIWKIELQERGAPHFHFMIFNCIRAGDSCRKTRYLLDVAWLREVWLEVIGDEYSDTSSGRPVCPQLDVEEIRGFRKAINYLCKYMSKPEEEAAGGSPAEPGASSDVDLNTSHIFPESIGRVWGYFNKGSFKIAPRRVVTLYSGRSFWEITQILCFIRSIVRSVGLSISWYSEDLEYWLDYWRSTGFVMTNEEVQKTQAEEAYYAANVGNHRIIKHVEAAAGGLGLSVFPGVHQMSQESFSFVA